MHDSTGFPSRRMVHEPQSPCPHPSLVPVSPISSRRKHSRLLAGSTSQLTQLPFRRNPIAIPAIFPGLASQERQSVSALSFLKRLAALLPAPYQNLVRYHGCFANRSRFRGLLPAPPPPPGLEVEPTAELATAASVTETDGETDGETEPDELLPPRPPRRTPWARLLMRTLKVDGLDCPRCHARMVLLALITAPRVIERILLHLRLPHTPPSVAPARAPREPEVRLWDADPDDSDEAPPGAHLTSRADARAPP